MDKVLAARNEYREQQWALVIKECADSGLTNNIAEIGYDLWHEYWGQGYMKEALISAIESGFTNMGLNRINAFVALENINSIKLLEKLGFKNEGVYRDKHLFRGKYYDHYSFSLLKRDWNQLRLNQ